MIKNLKAIKSTLLGLFLIGLGVYLLIDENYNMYFVTGLFASGVLLCLSPDKFIDVVTNFINKKDEIK